MKTKHKILSVLAIMAILAGLCIAMVSTASAAALTVNGAKATPATVNAVASWDVTMTKDPASTYVFGDVITITFPAGVTMPATITNSYVTVGGQAFVTGDLGCSVSGQALLITINTAMLTPINSGAAFHVIIAPAAGIKNPAVAKPMGSLAYMLKAKSTQDVTEGSTSVGFIPVYSSSPAAGNRYTAVTVTGQGWTANSGITIGGTLSGTGTSDAAGSFTATAYYTDTGHQYYGSAVNLADGAGQTQANSTIGTWLTGTLQGNETPVVPTFTLLPAVTLTPASGNVGSTVVVQGNDFGTGPITALTMGGVNLIPSITSGSLTLSSIDALGTNDDFKVTVKVPVTRAPFTPMNTGAQIVMATDSSTPVAKSGTGTFTINPPTVTVSPASGGAGTLITLTGTNFNPLGSITKISFGNDQAWGVNMPVVSGSGTWTYSAKVKADASGGFNVITVSEDNVTTTGTYFSVGTRSLAVTPASGPLGTLVVLTGSNMDVPTTANPTVHYLIAAADLKIQNTAWPISLLNSPWGGENIIIDSNGTIQATTLQIPGTGDIATLPTAGALAIQAQDQSDANPPVLGAIANGTFTVVRPTMVISPTTGVIGTTITVVGTGFVPNDDITVRFGKTNVVTGERVARPIADASGAFTATFSVPYNKGLTLGDVCKTEVEDTYGNNVDQKLFTVSTGSISTSPAAGTAGTLVTVTGAGLVPGNKIVAMSIDGWDVTPDKLPQIALDGTVTTTITVPAFIGNGVKVINVVVKNSQTGLETTYTNFITIAAGGGTTGNSVTERLVAIDGEFDQVWTLDAGTWKLFDPSDTANAEFTTLTPGMAIYIHTTQAVDNVSLGGVVRNLVSGWNMIGWVS